MLYHFLASKGPKGLKALALAGILALATPMFALGGSVWPTNVKTVYDNQPPTTEKELLTFLDLLPSFRTWARENHEEAHPYLNNGRPDFIYSAKAAHWVEKKGFEPRRFFCVMGRMAAALVIVEEGFDTKTSRPKDMPVVTEKETALARKHLGKMLTASGASAKTVPATPPKLPKRPDK
ncbi:MAG: hypothetical protein IJT59_06510 [Desulfovibrionaceae bacterium]|nr:hypothetical protein [Desulfovibrionaceae bacterium]